MAVMILRLHNLLGVHPVVFVYAPLLFSVSTQQLQKLTHILCV
jgi:hypothetical protein